jgi:hypothetical protein
MNIQLLNERAKVLHDILLSTYERYFHDSMNQGQKGLYETIIGAGIWYLPSGPELYSGKISKTALESLKVDSVGTKLVEEHSFPRKVGGKFLYELFKHHNGDFTEIQLVELFKTKLGKFNLVLKSENDRLKVFQKIENFTIGEEGFLKSIAKIEEYAYDEAGIELCDFSVEKYKEYKSFKGKLRSKKIDKSSLIFNL